MRSTFTLLAVAASLSGCASVGHQVGDKKTLASLSGQTVTYAVQTPSDFLLSTPENNRIPLVRVATMIKEGRGILTDNGVRDPAEAIGAGVANALQAGYGARIVPPPASATTAPAARVRIDVKTTNWGLFFKGSDQNQFGLVHSVTVQLVDVQNGRVIAGGTCKPASVDTAPVLSREAMLSNGAAGLKASLDTVAAQCVQFIKAQALSL